jgi:hypothetical protein
MMSRDVSYQLNVSKLANPSDLCSASADRHLTFNRRSTVAKQQTPLDFRCVATAFTFLLCFFFAFHFPLSTFPLHLEQNLSDNQISTMDALKSVFKGQTAVSLNMPSKCESPQVLDPVNGETVYLNKATIFLVSFLSFTFHSCSYSLFSLFIFVSVSVTLAFCFLLLVIPFRLLTPTLFACT